jgi:hypothetical protein
MQCVLRPYHNSVKNAYQPYAVVCTENCDDLNMMEGKLTSEYNKHVNCNRILHLMIVDDFIFTAEQTWRMSAFSYYKHSCPFHKRTRKATKSTSATDTCGRTDTSTIMNKAFHISSHTKVWGGDWSQVIAVANSARPTAGLRPKQYWFRYCVPCRLIRGGASSYWEKSCPCCQGHIFQQTRQHSCQLSLQEGWSNELTMNAILILHIPYDGSTNLQKLHHTLHYHDRTSRR